MNDNAAGTVPEGFGPIFRSSPVLDALGGFLSAGSAGSLRIGLRVGPSHLNSRRSLHGGVSATLADVGIGYLLAFGREPPRRLVTASLMLDYVDAAAEGDFVELRLRSVDEGRQLIHATADLLCGERPIARARGSFVKVAANAPPSP